MTKYTCIILGLVVALMGVAGLIPSWELGTEPMWHAIAKIIIGLVAIVIPFVDKKK
jgi:hypothetical protein